MWTDPNLIKVLKEDGVAVMPTDTVYGIVGMAQSEFVVNRIYELRKRAPDKPCIIIIGDESDLEKFSIILSDKQKIALKKYWPGPVSIVLDCPDEGLEYLHRGTKTLAFRVPREEELQKLLKKTGPLIAPSANTERFPPATNIAEAKKYFGDQVDLYIDGGEIKSPTSKVIKLHKNCFVDVLRN
ncbi:threonylcarbamoyl-AMP synthase [Candidatus Nomurabacteria bacterium RIFCSPHIGHO2_01_FULL_39_220]|uniref:L-threonylcarbamoyladenylate synthase n=1 Tax=Candidatus Nomurabacteria bacterium RIFCSPLOWO2_02_FULL_40_67 TaxID=1801787 RepID=A0A1F6Y2H4_9BACT|nr:MAG: Sua5/YciO/YrdC/YwlC family protein [Parcubacteria group bacterium GW2011_GWA2_40_37]KKS10944.1 MAG: Sua5/YciO/YrdC/YwlC family protein [Parcubacteria group bacterium GW2011_GWB1_41_5]OGI61577.1 MAG: threonylcarbamoyl-AMP synthase [Candidatus Nomurabacteria bacterium RBG_16_40_11]OGI71021.1 MAG: threonylcarbamoyl-AMP synthase [Candidatus Nomurabacteria bacterium RIFCSPHIGHO2_01_FULL_39_220]OGI72482.1 MAG: threonylcarbamoyl-AMP synthase [Candidatus Nomurabacteria bacterium RIFCSPHIGHO2_02